MPDQENRRAEWDSLLAQFYNPECLHIFLLGGFRLAQGGEVFSAESFSLRKACDLVKLLGLAPRHRLPREQVMEWLWPEGDPKASLNSMNQALRSARQALGVFQPAVYLHNESGFLELASEEELWVDVDAFESALAQARLYGDLLLYQAAQELYTGELLPEDRYADWSLQRREALQRTYLDSLLEMAVLQERAGDYKAAIQSLQSLVEVDPLMEEAHQGLMRNFALAGQRTQALRQYQDLQDILNQELGVEPDPITRNLHQQILAGAYPPGWQAQAAEGVPAMQAERQHNLPIQITSFIGREEALAKVEELLSSQRLVTLTGAGGVGKTRLALKVAENVLESYSQGVWLVELGDISDPELVAPSVAQVLNIYLDESVPVIDRLIQSLKTKQILLVLDTCEHLLEACVTLADALLKTCPYLSILATSREIFSLPGEAVFIVNTLSFPEPNRMPSLDELNQYEAIRLFVERASRASTDWALDAQNAGAVTKICQQLDGIPLAIELSAARVSALSVSQIAERLDNRFRLLTGGARTALPRQQTLLASIDWSFSLLEETERLLLLRLSVFQGGWTLELAQEVCSFDGLDEFDVLDGLTQLMNKSLIYTIRSPESNHRYRRLDTIRQYTWEKLLETGTSTAILDRHLGAFIHLAKLAEPHLRGKQQVDWLDQLETELDNLRAALAWALKRQAAQGLQLATSLFWLWHARGYRIEGENWLQLFHAKLIETNAKIDLALLATSWAQQAFLLGGSGRFGQPVTLAAQEALSLSEGLGEDGKRARALAFEILSWNASNLRQSNIAQKFGQHCLEIGEDLGDRFIIAEALLSLAISEPDPIKAQAFAERNLALRSELGDLDGLATAKGTMGGIHFRSGDFIRAQQLYQESIDLNRTVKNRWALIFWGFGSGRIYYETGEPDQAIDFFLHTLPIVLDLGEQAWIIRQYNALGCSFGLKPDWLIAEKYFHLAIDTARDNQAIYWEAISCINLAEVAWKLGVLETASIYYQVVQDIGQDEDNLSLVGLRAYASGKSALMQDNLTRADAYFREALRDFSVKGDQNNLSHCLESLSICAIKQDNFVQAARFYGIVASRRWIQDPTGMPWLISYDFTAPLASAQSSLGEEQYARLLEDAKSISIEEAVAYALEVGRDPA